MNKKRILIGATCLAVLVGGGFIIFSNVDILRERAFIFLPSNVPTTTVAMIFGGGLNKDGSLNDMVEDRVLAAVSLFRAGKVQKLMITGDDGRVRVDEVDAMREAVLALGVPTDKVSVDRHGYRTYDSCYRAAKVYDMTNVVAVSQFLHLSRIIFLCSHFGIGTTGVAADFHDYGFGSFYMNVRELGARLKAWLEINVSSPKPLVLSRE